MVRHRFVGLEGPEDWEELREHLLGEIPFLVRKILGASPQQQDLADEVGVTEATISYWLLGKRKPTPENAGKLLEAVESRLELMNYELEGAKHILSILQDVQKKLAPKKQRRKGK